MSVYRFLFAVAAFAVSCTAATFVVQAVLPSPGEVDRLAFLGTLFMMCLLGPLLFAWAMGPGPMGLVATVCAFAFPLLSLGALYFGFFRARSVAWLAVSALLWGAFGGVSTFIAVTGSI